MALSARIAFSLICVAAALVGAEQAWPQFRGPHQNGSPLTDEVALIDDLAAAKQMWKNDARIWCIDEVQNGFASPILVDGTVYLSYYQGDGEVVNPDAKMRARHPAMDDEDLERARSIGADDCLIAVDARTGKTKWLKRFPGSFNLNSPSQKEGGHFQSCFGDGAVVFYGTTGRVYAVEADSGELRWQADIGPVHREMQAKLAEALKAGKLPRWNRGVFKFAPIHAADVFVLGDGRGGLLAFDQRTGQQRWAKVADEQHKRGWGIRTNPVRWRSGGKDVLIAIAGNTTYAFDAATGKELWQAQGPANWSDGTPALAGDLLIGNKGSRDNTGINCWRLKPDGCEEVWSKDAAISNFQACSVMVYRDHVWAFAQPPKVKTRTLACLELATGRDLGPSITIASKGNSSGIAAGGRLLQEHNGGDQSLSKGATWDQGSGYAWALYSAEPGETKLLGKAVSGIANSVTPVIHQGLLYVRLTSGLACYDLRK